MALKECKECGKEVSDKADKCPNCGVSDPTTTAKDYAIGCLAMIFFLWIGWVILFPSTDSEPSTSTDQSQTTTQQEQTVDWEPVLNAVEQSKESGYLTRVEETARTVYVNPVMWRAFDAQTKENSVLTFARYMGYLTDQDRAVGITVKDNQSGRTIAEYGVFGGVEIK